MRICNILLFVSIFFLVLSNFPVCVNAQIPGDINGNGQTDPDDIMLPLLILSGLDTGITLYVETDVNGDGRIGMEEVLYNIRVLTGVGKRRAFYKELISDQTDRTRRRLTNITLNATSDGTTVKTVFSPGDDLYLNIVLSTDTEQMAGCTFSLTYPADKLTAPATNSAGVPVVEGEITSIFPFTTIINATPEKTYSVNSSEPGKILFSGAELADNGGSKTHPSEVALFTIKFKVKENVSGDMNFELSQTDILNPDAGWASADMPESAPVLIGALPDTDPNFGGDLLDDFPVLLSGFSANPTLMVSVQTTNEYEQWMIDNGYGIIGGPMDDYDHDGFANDQERLNATDPTAVTGDVSGVDITDPGTWLPDGYNALTDFRVSNLDIDGNGRASLMSDALLLIRHMAGTMVFDDAALIRDVVGTDSCTRCTAPEIRAYIDTIMQTVFDVDNSGISSLVTDAMLIIRHMAGGAVFDDAALTDGALDTDSCARCEASEIRAYIDLLIPE